MFTSSDSGGASGLHLLLHFEHPADSISRAIEQNDRWAECRKTVMVSSTASADCEWQARRDDHHRRCSKLSRRPQLEPISIGPAPVAVSADVHPGRTRESRTPQAAIRSVEPMAIAIRPTPTIAPASFGSTGDVRKADHEGNCKRDTQNQTTNHGISPTLLTDRETTVWH